MPLESPGEAPLQHEVEAAGESGKHHYLAKTSEDEEELA